MKYLWLTLAVLGLVIGLVARSNNSHTLRNLGLQAIATDNAGADSHAQLLAADHFAAGHMSDPIRIVLQASFNRATVQAEAASTPTVSNDSVYAQAQAACSGHTDSITQAKCNQDYLSQHLQAATPPVAVPKPKLSDYTFDVRSPIWTPDLAGLSLAGAILAAVMALASTVIGRRR